MGVKREHKRPIATKLTKVVKINKERFADYLAEIGETQCGLSGDYSSAGYLGWRFKHCDGTVPQMFIDWCNSKYPNSAAALEKAVMTDASIEMLVRNEKPKPRSRTDSRLLIDRDAFMHYCGEIGHTLSTLSIASGHSVSYIKNCLRDNRLSSDFIDWCQRTYPRQKDLLLKAILPEAEPDLKPEQLTMKIEEMPKPVPSVMPQITLPSVLENKLVCVQPVSILRFNELIDALNMLGDKIQKLEEAWSSAGGDN